MNGLSRAEIEKLRDEIVPQFAAQGLTRRDCFSLALAVMFKSPGAHGARLVHASLESAYEGGAIIQHAWCELLGKGIFEDGSKGPITVCIDYTQIDPGAIFLPRDIYYAQMKIVESPPLRKYTREEALLAALTHGCDGPWE